MTATEAPMSMGSLQSDPAFSASTATESTPNTSVEQTSTQSAETADGTVDEGAQPVDASETTEQTTEPGEFDEEDITQPDRTDAKEHHFSIRKAQALKQAFDTWREVNKIIPGASLDTIRELASVQAGVQKMHADFATGQLGDISDPDNSFVGYWRNENPEAFDSMLVNAPQLLAQVNPQAARVQETYYDQKFIERCYRQGAKDPAWWDLAQHLDQRMNGRYRPKSEMSKPRDTFSDERARFEQDRQKFYNDQKAERESRLKAWATETDTAVKSSVSQLVDRALSDPKLKAFEGKPQMKWMRRELADKIAEAEQGNAAWTKQFNAMRQTVEARPSEEGRKSLVDAKTEFARSVIRASLKRVIEEATAGVLGQNAAAHSQAAAAAGKRQGVNGGAPINGVAVNPKLKNAMTMAELQQLITG